MSVDLRTPFLLVPTRPLHRWLRSGAFFRGPEDAVTLTFDDGPHPERTPAVLDLLAAHGARATFFLVGEKASRHPELVRRIAAGGHGLGNHSWSHPVLPLLRDAAMRQELDRTHALLEDLAGQRVNWTRPPFGWGDARYYDQVRARGWQCALWSVDSLDWTGLFAGGVYRLAARAGPGDVVLFHDGADSAMGLLPALKRLLEGAVQRRIALGRLPEVAA